MTPTAIFSLASLALFSLADLRYRVAPGAGVFFLAMAILAAPEDTLRVGLVVLAVGWGAAALAICSDRPGAFLPFYLGGITDRCRFAAGDGWWGGFARSGWAGLPV